MPETPYIDHITMMDGITYMIRDATANARIDQLQQTGVALIVAALFGQWLYLLGTIYAPTEGACAVTSETATMQGTVSGTTLTLN